jgi:putative DNA primase/helicase
VASVANDAVQRLLDKLEGVKPKGSYWTALCPAHDDKQSSLSIGNGKDGRALMKCHAGCAFPAIIAAMALPATELFADGARSSNGNSTAVVAKSTGVETRARLVKSYDYYAADGRLAFQSCRLEPKTFRQRHRNGGGEWVWNLQGVELVPYRLPELVEAVEHGRRVFVVEGEKDADALVELGYPATTNPMGAGKWKDEFSAYLTKADVVILPDNDDTGRDHAQKVAASIEQAGAASIRVVQLPDVPEKGDVSDWLAAGGDLDQLETLIGQAPLWSSDKRPRVKWRLRELLGSDSIMRPPPPIVPRLAWAGRSTLLAAREKSGKSTLTGYIATQVTRGGAFLDDPCVRGDVLVIGLEEYLGDLARRLQHFGADPDRVIIVNGFHGDPRTRPLELASHIDADDPLLVIIDSLAAWSDGLIQDDNNATQMASVVQPLTDLAHSRGVALVIVHHARKSDGRARGSTAIMAGTDVVCEFFTPDEDADPTLRRMRSRGRVPVQPVYDLRFDGDHYYASTGEGAPLESRILGAVGSRPGISISDLADHVRARRDDVAKEVHRMIATRTLLNLSDSAQRAKLALPEARGPGLAL